VFFGRWHAAAAAVVPPASQPILRRRAVAQIVTAEAGVVQA
jgi:hypothetical protein